MDILGTKNRSEREEEEVERLVRPLPKLKPPRHDRRRERVQVDRDPDVDGDSDTCRDPDMSMNRREIGGSLRLPRVSSWYAGDSDKVDSESRVGGQKARSLQDLFPPYVVDKFSGETPEVIDSLLTSYHTAVEKIPGDLTPNKVVQVLVKVSPDFTLTPSRVPVPESAQDSSVDEASVYNYQVTQVAINLAIRHQAVASLTSFGVTRKLATKVVDYSLLCRSVPPDTLRTKVIAACKKLFLQESSETTADERFGVVRRTPPKVTSIGVRRGLIQATSRHPDLTLLAVASFQGEDFVEALRSFRISRSDSASVIYGKVLDAGRFFKDRSRIYPVETLFALDNPYQLFRSRVRSILGTLPPDVGREVRRKLSVLEVDLYDRDLMRFHRFYLKYLKNLARWERDQSQPSSHPEPKPLEPKLPAKPSDYDLVNQTGTGRTQVERIVGMKDLPLYSSYPLSDLRMGPDMSTSQDPALRTAVYHGVQPYPAGREGVSPYQKWEQASVRDLGSADFSNILAEAKVWLKSPILAKSVSGMLPDTRFRAALDLAIRDSQGGRYSSAIDASLYNMLLAKLAGVSQSETLLTIREAASNQTEGTMPIKIAKNEAKVILARLDTLAGRIQENAQEWGIPFKTAKEIVNALDATADEIESAVFGPGSLAQRQVNVLKSAKVLQKDSDEGYMDTFDAPMATKQTDSDESYMSLFDDDQSTAVSGGKSSTGRPLAP